ncbi:MAG: hypothetical protein OEZ68_20085 [Gammaproteobacteria bacterium]|nr:hypothetical protein [Gammaproteobacteria bacterium]MDH5803109.1 hypothetical protein [Gammaproteobacteria bacterium]
MFRIYHSCRSGVISLALAFVLMQSYVLYTSTYHVLHHSVPMCPACVAIKNYQGAAVSTAQFVIAAFSDISIVEQTLPELFQTLELKYLSRAPPALR